MTSFPWPDLLKLVAWSALPPQVLFANTLRPSTLLAAAANHNGQGSMNTIFTKYPNPDTS
jgi:hypothetical protein